MDKTFTIDGFTITARVEHHDDSHSAPWIAEDGHGPVSDWRKRNYAGRYDKAPGELLLCDDGGNVYRGSARFYDFAEACRMALKDGWGCEGGRHEGETDKAYAARAARADFERLRGWCSADWYYVGVVLSVERNGVVLDNHAASLWGIESDAGEYLDEVANELADEALERGKELLASLCACEDA